MAGGGHTADALSVWKRLASLEAHKRHVKAREGHLVARRRTTVTWANGFSLSGQEGDGPEQRRDGEQEAKGSSEEKQVWLNVDDEVLCASYTHLLGHLMGHWVEPGPLCGYARTLNACMQLRGPRTSRPWHQAWGVKRPGARRLRLEQDKSREAGKARG